MNRIIFGHLFFMGCVVISSLGKGPVYVYLYAAALAWFCYRAFATRERVDAILSVVYTLTGCAMGGYAAYLAIRNDFAFESFTQIYGYGVMTLIIGEAILKSINVCAQLIWVAALTWLLVFNAPFEVDVEYLAGHGIALPISHVCSHMLFFMWWRLNGLPIDDNPKPPRKKDKKEERAWWEKIWSPAPAPVPVPGTITVHYTK